MVYTVTPGKLISWNLLHTTQWCLRSYSKYIHCIEQYTRWNALQYLPTAVTSLSVTSMVKGIANSLSVLRTSTWLSPSGTEYTAGSKNTLNSLSNMEKRKRKYTEWHVRQVHSCESHWLYSWNQVVIAEIGLRPTKRVRKTLYATLQHL